MRTIIQPVQRFRAMEGSFAGRLFKFKKTPQLDASTPNPVKTPDLHAVRPKVIAPMGPPAGHIS
jgi:hypothetical protein